MSSAARSKSEVMWVENKMPAPLFGQGAKELQQLGARNRVQSAGGFVQHKEPRLVGKRQREQIFYLHAARKFLKALALVQLKARQAALVGRFVPAAVKAPGHGGKVRSRFKG